MKYLLALALCALPVHTHAIVLAGWISDINDPSANEIATGVMGNDLNLASGASLLDLRPTSSLLAANGFESAGAAQAVSNNDYIEFGISIANGWQTHSLDFLNISYQSSGAASPLGAGPTNLAIVATTSNFASESINLFTDTDIPTFAEGSALRQISLAPITNQNLTAADTLTFRIYGWGAAAASGAFLLTNDSNINLNGNSGSISIEGDISPVPEIEQYALLLSVILLSACLIRKSKERQRSFPI